MGRSPCVSVTALRQARLGAFDHWGETPEGALGLVILLDQVSRNIHRGSPLAFAADAKALDLGQDICWQGLSPDAATSSCFLAHHAV